jgi:GNAT superfamily N-acetyltransferase
MQISAGPSRIIEHRLTEDGRTLELRTANSSDSTLMNTFLSHLSTGSRYFRFGHVGVCLSSEIACSMCSHQPGEHERLIILTDLGGETIQIGCAGYQVLSDSHRCEFDIVVADAWQGMGVSSWLMDAMIGSARQNGLQEMFGRTHATNTRMHRLARRHRFCVLTDEKNDGITIMRLQLDRPRPFHSEP